MSRAELMTVERFACAIPNASFIQRPKISGPCLWSLVNACNAKAYRKT